MISKEDQSIIKYLAGENALEPSSISIKFSYICNPDKTIRWLFPDSLKSPMFLNFYSTSSFRSKALNFLIKTAYFLGLSKLVSSGNVNINIKQGSKLDTVLTKHKRYEFSIFTGTVGINRKAVIELHDNKYVNFFVKIALTESSKGLVQKEAESLEFINTLKSKTLVVPKLLSYDNNDTIAISNIKPKSFEQSSVINTLHIDALSELYKQSHNNIKWTELTSLKDSKINALSLINGYDIVNNLDEKQVKKLAINILLLTELIEHHDESLTVATSHGDFTPWNMYPSKDTLHLFDWEMSKKNTPLLYDAIHFIFQSQIMISHTNYIGVLGEIYKLRKLKSTIELIQSYNVNFDKNYMYYLVYNVTYYLNKYIKQKYLHEQVFWQIDLWEAAVNDVLDKKGVIFK